jgi:hypothetical protein
MERIINMFRRQEQDKQNAMNTIRNGRVDIETSGDETKVPRLEHPLYMESKRHLRNKYRSEAVGYMLDSNDVQQMFFSDDNIDLLQQLIANHVYQQSNGTYRIGKQDELQLKIIMKSIYLQYAKNLPHNVMEQVRELNSHVLDYAVPTILTNVEQYVRYKNDVSTLPTPIELPQSVSRAGMRTNSNYIL